MVKRAILFPGQGAQYAGMGKDLYQNYPVFREIFDRAAKILGMDLAEVCFEGPQEELTRTRICQPAIFTMSYAVFKVLKNEIPQLQFDGFAGLSLGEFTALTAAGSLSFEEALRSVEARGRFMEEACLEKKGTMASILGLGFDAVQSACRKASERGIVTVANVNSPAQIVVSGEPAGVEALCSEAKALGAKRAIPLDVSGAFHSPLMESARVKLEFFLKDIDIKKPEGIFMANVKGAGVSDSGEIRGLLISQVTGSVLWESTIREFVQEGFGLFVEAGCGRVLSGLMKKIAPQVQTLNIEDIESLEKAKLALNLKEGE